MSAAMRADWRASDSFDGSDGAQTDEEHFWEDPKRRGMPSPEKDQSQAQVDQLPVDVPYSLWPSPPTPPMPPMPPPTPVFLMQCPCYGCWDPASLAPCDSCDSTSISASTSPSPPSPSSTASTGSAQARRPSVQCGCHRFQSVSGYSAFGFGGVLRPPLTRLLVATDSHQTYYVRAA